MKQIDLHAYTIDEALKAFTEFYNNSLGKGSCLRIIHGYGSIGGTGKICDHLRKLLEEHSDKLRFTPGEEVEGNPGLTIVYPKKPLPSVLDGLSAGILDFCAVPRVREKILGRFRQHGQKEVLSLLKKLVGQKRLRTGAKGTHKTYVKF